MITVIRLKSDNYNCYVSPEVYREITLTMSSGDYGAHKAREIEVSSNTLENIRYFSKGLGYIDKMPTDIEHNHAGMYYFYNGTGDCWIETEL